MPSSVYNDADFSLQLLYRKISGKWKKRVVVLRKSLDVSQKYYLDIHRPGAKGLRKLCSAFTKGIEIFPHSHVVIQDIADDNKTHLLSLVPVASQSKERGPCQFASHERNNLDNLAYTILATCSVASFEVSIDSEHGSQIPTGTGLLHIWRHNACITSKFPMTNVLQRWKLVEPLEELFKWEKNVICVQDSQNSSYSLYARPCEVNSIQKELENCRESLPCENSFDGGHCLSSTASSSTNFPTNPSPPQTSTIVNHFISDIASISQLPATPQELHPVDSEIQEKKRRKSLQSDKAKEHVEIRFPGHTQPRRCKSETSLRHFNYKEEIILPPQKTRSLNREYSDLSEPIVDYSDKTSCIDQWPELPPRKRSISNENSQFKDTNLESKDCSSYYANVQLRPTFYIYTNAVISQEEGQGDTANTYVNIFSGSSFKGCYENWEHQSSIYTKLPPCNFDAPPLPPRPLRPVLPPRHSIKSDSFGSQRPPPLPPRTKCHVPVDARFTESLIAPRIHVAVFTSTAVIGRMWFLRVVFMHQDDKDSTFKRVKDIESLSNHICKKSQSLEVMSHICVTVTTTTAGFDILNANQQEIQLSDIDNLRKGDWFVIEFHVQNSDQTKDLFMGNVSIEPQSNLPCRRACRAEMGIDGLFQRQVINQDLKSTVRQSLLPDYNKRIKLCRALDITLSSYNHNWRQVAGSLGFTYPEIIELQDKACRSVLFSPTDEVLRLWEQREPTCSLEKLVNVLREIGRLDVVQDLGFSITLES